MIGWGSHAGAAVSRARFGACARGGARSRFCWFSRFSSVGLVVVWLRFSREPLLLLCFVCFQPWAIRRARPGRRPSYFSLFSPSLTLCGSVSVRFCPLCLSVFRAGCPCPRPPVERERERDSSAVWRILRVFSLFFFLCLSVVRFRSGSVLCVSAVPLSLCWERGVGVSVCPPPPL